MEMLNEDSWTLASLFAVTRDLEEEQLDKQEGGAPEEGEEERVDGDDGDEPHEPRPKNRSM